MRRLRLVLAGVATVAGVAVAVTVVFHDRSPVTSAGTFHVTTGGNDTNNGAVATPWRTVGKAVSTAASNSTIIVHTGRYHEQVQIYNKAINLRTAGDGPVTLDGTTNISTGWTNSGGDWSHPWTKEFGIRTGAPVDPVRPVAGYTDQLFISGVQATQVLTRAEVVPGTFFHDRPANLLWIGDDPTGKTVEASDLSYGLYLNKANGSTVDGLTVRRYGTQPSDFAAVRIYANDVTVSHLTVDQNAYIGISANGQRDTIDQSTLTGNGYIGAHANTATNLTLSNTVVTGNNRERFDNHDSAAGVKVTSTNGATFTGNTVSINAGPGIWTDIATSRVTVAHNNVQNNQRSGIQIELSGQVIVAGNVAVGNGEAGVWVLESNDVQVWNNALFSNLRDLWVEEGPRTNSAKNATTNWDLNRVTVRNNTLGGGRAGAPALLNCDDWTNKRACSSGTATMAVTSDFNRFWLPPSSPTKAVTRWARWPSSLAVSSTTAAATTATGQEANSQASTGATNPYAVNPAAGDWRMPPGTPAGATPPADVAAALGTTGPIPPGPVRRTPDGTVPTTTLPPTTTSTTTTTTVTVTVPGSTTTSTTTTAPPTGTTSTTTPEPAPTIGPTTTADTTKPSAPTGLKVTVTGRQVDLTWTAPPQTDITGYQIIDTNQLIDTTTAPADTLTSVTPGAHYYQVTAIDTTGNISVKTSPVKVTVA